MNIRILEKAGLTKNEIKVYLNLLETGITTTGPLIKKTAINSSKVYENLGRLERKGLVSFILKANKRYFQATDPERLLDYLDEKERHLEEQKEEIKKLLPELELIRTKSKGEEQEAVIYQGLKGYKTILENMLKELTPDGKYMAFASGMLKQVLGSYWYIFQKKKKIHNIKARCIWDEKIRNQKDYLKEYVGEGKFIKKGSYISPVDFFIYNDKVIQVSYTTKPLFAVLIRSEGLASSYRDLFETIWKAGVR